MVRNGLAHRKEYKTQVACLIRNIIRHRRQLITRRKSIINELKAVRIIEDLERNMVNNFSQKGMAKFLLCKHREIRYLIKHDDINKFNELNRLVHLAGPFSKL